MKQNFFRIILTLVAFMVYQPMGLFSQNGTGLLFDDESYAAQPRLSPSLSFTSTEATAMSLKKYCPQPGNQGQMGSCVGWASGYGALSIAQAIRDGISDRNVITGSARSALYVYNQIKIGGCESGSFVHSAMELLQEKGSPRLRDFAPNDCYVLPGASVDALASEMKIKEYHSLFQPNDGAETKINQTRNSILAQKPVVIGMFLTSSFYDVSTEGVWRPRPGERSEGGHAMAVIGFNDFTREFEILNSWGESWGNGGFFKMSFDDYAKYCKYGFQFSLQQSGPDPEGFSFNAGFKLNKITGYDYDKGELIFTELPVSKSGNYYQTSNGAIAVGDYFKIFAGGMSADNYLYIFSIKPDDSGELLFPRQGEVAGDQSTVVVVPIIPSVDSYVELPAEKDRSIMADHSGTDYLIFLFSANPIDDIETIVENVADTYGDVYDRLSEELGDRMVPASDISYYLGQMGFRGQSSTGDVVPLVLRVEVK